MFKLLQFAASIAVILPGAVFGQANATAERARNVNPRFADFRVPTPFTARKTEAFLSWPDSPDETTDHLQGRIRKAAKEGPDFAGHFAVVRVGCGSDCNNIWIVDVQTGAISDAPFLGATRCVPFSDGPLLSYKLDSALLVVTGSLERSDPKTKTFHDGLCGQFYFRWAGHSLKLIHSMVPAADSKSSNARH